MLLDFYGLKREPFGVTPDPDFLYLSPPHREALASLLCGIEMNRGFLALIAPPGMGKTTILFKLLKHFRTSARTVFMFHTQCTSREFMRMLLSELGCENDKDADLATILEQFNSALLQEYKAGRRVIIVVDEAQNLEPAVLETVRLLSDFETPQAKLLQIVLAGQPELADKLAKPSLQQLRQRISVLCSLKKLSETEVDAYIEHRLKTAGHPGSLFTPEAIKAIAKLSDGIPRNINNLCANSLSLGCALQIKTITAENIAEVEADFDVTKLLSNFSEQNGSENIPSPKPTSKLGSDTVLPMTPSEAMAYMRLVTSTLSKRRS
jgi:general secretion pathway protein A